MHKDKMLPIVLFAGALIALPALASVETEQATVVRRAFGPPPGTACRYALKVTARYGQGEYVQEMEVTVFRAGGEDASKAVLLVRDKGSVQASYQSPVAFVRLDEHGRASMENDSAMMGSPTEAARAALFVSIQGPGFALGTKWQQRESVTPPYIPHPLVYHAYAVQDVEVEHLVAPGQDDAAALRLQSRMTTDRRRMGRAAGFSLTGWKRDLLVDARTGRPRSVRVEAHVEHEDPRQGTQTQLLTVELNELAHRALTEAELASLPGEMKALRAVSRAAMERNRGSSRPRGRLARLFGFGGKKKAPGDPNALMDAYVKNHPEGVLVAAAEPLRKHINWRLQQEQQQRHMETRAAQMLNQPAPDFTLKDLNDKDVSLSDFKGKVVMLSFWGYG